MALSYRFQSILGAPYRGGGLVFQNGDLLYSPVGNRIQVGGISSDGGGDDDIGDRKATSASCEQNGGGEIRRI